MSVLFNSPIRTTVTSILAIIFFLSISVFSHAAQVTLAWDPNNPAPDGYQVYQRVAGQNYDYNTPVWPKAGDDPVQTNCTINDLADDTSYFFVVRAYMGSNESGDSNEVNYVTSPASQATEYTITVNAGANGSISPASAVIAEGGSQTFTIAANPGYRIQDVRVDGNSVGSVSTYTFSQISADHTISAQFTVIAYHITASAQGCEL